MEFYLNQKSLPMIRKCGNCRFYHSEFGSCSLTYVSSAYEHEKKIFLSVQNNHYCPKHKFRNEEVLKKEAVIVEIESLSEAMRIINDTKQVKEIKKNYNAE